MCPTGSLAAAPSAAQEEQGRHKGSADTNPVAVSPGAGTMQGLMVLRSVLAQRSVLQDAASVSPLPSRDSMGVIPWLCGEYSRGNFLSLLK